ncbi:MRC [Mytilus coruscus]|uniref:MRC n=1 Tax=Mytilus coruscus TaxID=42192 RepID=A0A6J8BRK4_MYTCO|nr:MRC [Mytilus coruscus]
MKTSDHTYDKPTDEKGYTQPESISDNYRKYDDLKPSGSHYSYFEPQPDPKPYDIQSRFTIEVCIKSKGSGNAGFRISKIWTEFPFDWKTFDVRCFKEFSEQRTWFQARDYCRSIGSDLVSAQNEKENNFLITNFIQTSQWIGLSIFQNNGKYVWSD